MNIKVYQKNILPPTNIKINYTRDNKHVVITWNEVKNPDKNIVNGEIKKIMYNIYKGLGKNGIYYKINKEPLTSNRYEDYDLSRNPGVINWYKVSVVYLNSEGTYIEGASSDSVCHVVHNTDRWFTKMNERNFWILQNTGLLFELYTRKYDGEKCDCYDTIRGRAGSSFCPKCLGTGFVGGYEGQCQLYIRLKSVEESLIISPQMYNLNTTPGAWTLSPIKIMNRDILVNTTDGVYYQVTSQNLSQVAGVYFHQELNLKMFDPLDPIYTHLKRTTLYPAYK